MFDFSRIGIFFFAVEVLVSFVGKKVTADEKWADESAWVPLCPEGQPVGRAVRGGGLREGGHAGRRGRRRPGRRTTTLQLFRELRF